MMRGLFLSVLSLTVTLQLTGCSLFSSDKAENGADSTEQVETAEDSLADSTDSKPEGDTASTEDESLFDESTDASGEPKADAKTDLAQTTESGSAASDDTAFPETPMDDSKTTADTGVKLDEGTSGTLDSSTDSGSLDSSSTSDTLSANPPDSTPVTTEDVAAAATDSGEVSSPVVPSSAPLKKVESAPLKRGGALLNRVYLAREGDTWKSVSQRIYGRNRSKEIKKWNPFIKRNLKVGDKVYYNSPKSPEDSAQMLTYFEENGVAPQTYVAKSGDDLKSVSKQLLGNSRSWMEVYATNPNLESKDGLVEGTELRYWGSDALASIAPATSASTNASMAQSSGANDGANSSSTPPGDMANQTPPPTDLSMNQPGDIPPPTTPDATGGGAPSDDPFAQAPPPVDAGSVPPPPPTDLGNPTSETAPPPPPPADGATEDIDAEASDKTELMIMVGIAVVVLALIVFFIKRRKKNEIDLGQTQV